MHESSWNLKLEKKTENEKKNKNKAETQAFSHPAATVDFHHTPKHNVSLLFYLIFFLSLSHFFVQQT